MFPARANFSTSVFGDAWVIDRVGTGAGSNEDICQTDGGWIALALTQFVRFRMNLDRTRDPFMLDGVRFTTQSAIDRVFGGEALFSSSLLRAYHECVNRINRTSGRVYFPLDRVSAELIAGLFAGGIATAKTTQYQLLTANQWAGTFGDRSGERTVIVSQDAIMPALGAPLLPVQRSIAPTPGVTCTGRGNMDASYSSPAERYQQSEQTGAIALVAGIGLLLVLGSK